MGFLKTVLPWIGAAATGNVPMLVSMAANQLSGVLGVDVKPTADAISKAFAGATPEQLQAAKLADQDFALKMQALGFQQVKDLESIAAGDRKDARSMQVAQRSPVPAALSVLVTVGFFGILLGLMLGVLHVSDSQALLLMLGSLGTGWGMVMAFWFGTTSDSGRKTDLLAAAEPVK